MKESYKSLRAYFLVVGVLSILGNISLVVGPTFSAILKALALAQLVVGGAFIYAGLKLDELLRTSPAKLKQLIVVSVAISMLGTLGLAGLIAAYAGLPAAMSVRVVVPLVLAPVIGAYLYRNVNRLATELEKG